MKSSIPALVGICCVFWLAVGCSSPATRDDGAAQPTASQEGPEGHPPRKPCDTPDCFLHGHHRHPKLFKYQRYRNPHL